MTTSPEMPTTSKKATLYRMVMDAHVCPYGLKARHFLRRQGYKVDDQWLTSREQTEAFKTEHGAETTPQVFICPSLENLFQKW